MPTYLEEYKPGKAIKMPLAELSEMLKAKVSLCDTNQDDTLRALLRVEDSSPSVRVEGRTNITEVRNKFDLGDDEKQEEGRRRLSHRTPEKVEDDHKMLFLPVDLEVATLRDWSEQQSEQTEGLKGALVEVNRQGVAVFRFGSSLVATEARCPHAGGPLHLGDIEELPDGSLCLRCPSHRWAFSLGRRGIKESTRRTLFSEEEQDAACVEASLSTGSCLQPPGRDLRLVTYPVRRGRGGHVSIGFHSLHHSVLVDQHF